MNPPTSGSQPLTVSVVIPAWNRAGWIGESLDSLLVQTRRPDEVVVVDDGSVDGTASIAAAHPLAPTVITIPHAGVAAARNRGIEASGGDLVAFLDSDDLWLREKLERHLRVFEVPECPAVSCTHYEVRELVDSEWALVQTRRHSGPLALDTLLDSNRIGTTTVVAQRAALVSVGGFAEDLVRGSDYELWLRLAERRPIHVLGEVLAVHRRHAERLSGDDPGTDSRTHDEVISRRLAATRVSANDGAGEG